MENFNNSDSQPGYLDTANDSSPDYVVFNGTVIHSAEAIAHYNKTVEIVDDELGKILTILKVKSFFLHLLNWCFPIYCLATTKHSPSLIFEKKNIKKGCIFPISGGPNPTGLS